MLRPWSVRRCAVIALTLIVSGPVHAQPGPDLNANAALKYWRAFASLPKLDQQEQHQVADEPATMPSTPRAKEIIQISDRALHELHSGAALPICAWGMSYEDGIMAISPEGPAARLLGGLACLRARVRFEEGRPAEALDDVFATLTLARHVSVGGALIRILVGIGIEARTIDVLAAQLPRLDAATLKGLQARLQKLPTGATMAEGLLSEEKIDLDWMEKNVRGLKDRDKLVAFLDLCTAGDESQKDRTGRGKAFLEACGGTPEGVLKQLEEMRPCYATFARKMTQPPEEIAKAYEAEKQRMDKNAVFKLMAPALTRCRQREASLEIRRAMLRAAVAVQLEGKDALKALPAPYAQGPLEFRAFDGGFELKAIVKFQDTPLILTAGKSR